MKIANHNLILENLELLLLFDNAHQPAIEVNGIHYASLSHLLQVIPQLEQQQNSAQLAQVVNFLAKGIEFQYIEDIELFKKNYWQQIEGEQLKLIPGSPELKDYGVFDLSVMHAPLLRDHKLIFFVRHDYLSIPYQVTLFYPLNREFLHMSYELLPLLFNKS